MARHLLVCVALFLGLGMGVALSQQPPANNQKSPASEDLSLLQKETLAFFKATPQQQAEWRFDPKLDRLLATNEAEVRKLIWKTYQTAGDASLKANYAQKKVQFDTHTSAYTVKQVGKRPTNGWPLFIAMHGGGGAPKRVNDSQWEIMQIYYKDQPSVTGYQYVALRAPNDVWNGFYDNYVPPLITNLIRQFTLYGDVDPDKVYLMGYSHGGYGAFFIGPKIPDRFAAIHSSAAAPTGGTISPKTLRNTPFTFMIGEKDTAYGRRKLCEEFSARVEKRKADDKDGYPVKMELMKGYGHGGLPDRDKIKDMYKHTRNPVPTRLCWDLTDSKITHFFWLSVDAPHNGASAEASITNNAVTLTTKDLKQAVLHLDSRLINFAQPLKITHNGKMRQIPVRPSLVTLCRSLVTRGDPNLAWTCAVLCTTE